MPDLITNARAKANVPNATSADDATINTLITAAGKAIQRYCRRDFVAMVYDELYNGNGDRRLLLRQYPIVSVQSVRCRPVTVLTITNSNTALNQQARVTVTAAGLTLFRTASGVASTDTSVTFATHATLTTLAAAVTALGNGWSAQVVGDYGSWPSADLRAPQGALAACGQFAELKLHTYELAGYQIDERRGWLLRAIPYTDPELMRPEDLAWPVGVANFRVQYTAGHATVPEDVQEACAELVATWFAQRGRDLSLQRENTAGTYSYVADTGDGLPGRVRALLQPYRNHRVLNGEG